MANEIIRLNAGYLPGEHGQLGAMHQAMTAKRVAKVKEDLLGEIRFPEARTLFDELHQENMALWTNQNSLHLLWKDSKRSAAMLGWMAVGLLAIIIWLICAANQWKDRAERFAQLLNASPTNPVQTPGAPVGTGVNTQQGPVPPPAPPGPLHPDSLPVKSAATR